MEGLFSLVKRYLRSHRAAPESVMPTNEQFLMFKKLRSNSAKPSKKRSKSNQPPGPVTFVKNGTWQTFQLPGWNAAIHPPMRNLLMRGHITS
eukprot:4406361-Amphidinium_carterae.3